MVSENVKSIKETRKKNEKAIKEKVDPESNLKSFFWINEKAMN